MEKLRFALPYAFSLLLTAALYYALHEFAFQIHYTDLVHDIRATSPTQIYSALLFTLLSFAALMTSEISALRAAGFNLPRARAWATSFLSQSVVHTTGFGLILGASLRYRFYASSGLSLADVGRVQLIFSSGFGLATFVLLAAALLFEPGYLVNQLGGDASLWQAVGGLMLLATAVLLLWNIKGSSLRILGRSFTPPATHQSLQLVALAILDLLACAAVLYVLLPPGLSIGYPALLGAFLTALLLGLVSHVPGGLGVFEASLMLLLAPTPELTAATLGALLLFRVIYYVLPFMLTTGLLAAIQLGTWGRSARWLVSIAHVTTALLTMAAGAILVLSGATPVEHDRLHLLGQLLPLELIEVSHLMASIFGLVMVVVAYGLRLRLREAWFMALLLSAGGVALALVKGLELGVALLLFFNVLILLAGRSAFNRRGSLLAARPTTGWWLSVAAVLTAAFWLLLFSYRHVQYRDDLWWQLELNAQASRSLRAVMAAAVAALMLGLRNILRPTAARLNLPDASELSEAAGVIARFPTAENWIALTGDKYLLWNAQRTAFLMYGVQGRTWVALGEPVGEPEAGRELLWQFLEEVDHHGGRPAFYQIGTTNLTEYIDLGLHPYKLGESALVNLKDFSLQGGKRSNLRASCNKAEKANLSFEWLEPDQLPDVIDELEAVSNEWLEQHQAREKRFSLGYFSRPYLAHLPVAVIRQDKRIIAFANIWPAQAGSAISIDLMRHRTDAPAGTMDYLLVQIMLAGKAQGYGFFDLGMAPLSGLPEHRLAGNWAQVARLLADHGERFYNFRGLRSYKDKFSPEWQPRYLLCKPYQLATVLLDISVLISGGVRGIIMK